MEYPVDTLTGQQSGPALHGATQYVVVGWLATHPDGYQARLGPDETLAKLYAARQHATLEPMFVRRRCRPNVR